jgi:hypothetical protein
MLDKEFQYFLDHQGDLVKEHSGKFVVIKDHEILGFFDTLLEAYSETSKKHKPGTFLIQQCIAGPEAYTQVFHSGLVFGHR